jgi:hypothetical protein
MQSYLNEYALDRGMALGTLFLVGLFALLSRNRKPPTSS